MTLWILSYFVTLWLEHIKTFQIFSFHIKSIVQGLKTLLIIPFGGFNTRSYSSHGIVIKGHWINLQAILKNWVKHRKSWLNSPVIGLILIHNESLFWVFLQENSVNRTELDGNLGSSGIGYLLWKSR